MEVWLARAGIALNALALFNFFIKHLEINQSQVMENIIAAYEKVFFPAVNPITKMLSRPEITSDLVIFYILFGAILGGITFKTYQLSGLGVLFFFRFIFALLWPLFLVLFLIAMLADMEVFQNIQAWFKELMYVMYSVGSLFLINYYI